MIVITKDNYEQIRKLNEFLRQDAINKTKSKKEQERILKSYSLDNVNILYAIEENQDNSLLYVSIRAMENSENKHFIIAGDLIDMDYIYVINSEGRIEKSIKFRHYDDAPEEVKEIFDKKLDWKKSLKRLIGTTKEEKRYLKILEEYKTDLIKEKTSNFNQEPLKREDMMQKEPNIYKEPLKREDMMQKEPNIYKEPLKREDMMQKDVDINNQFDYDEDKGPRRR